MGSTQSSTPFSLSHLDRTTPPPDGTTGDIPSEPKTTTLHADHAPTTARPRDETLPVLDRRTGLICTPLRRVLLVLLVASASAFAGTTDVAVAGIPDGSGPVALSPLPENLPRHYGVVGMRLRGSGDDLRVTHVRVGSPADRAGVQIGDLLRGADTYRLTTLQQTLDYLQSLPPDSSVVLHLVRQGEPLQVHAGVTDRRRLYGLMIEQGLPAPVMLARHERWLTQDDDVRQSIDTLILSLDATASLDSLRRALQQDATAYGYDCRLADADLALQHPQAAAQPIQSLADELTDADTGQRLRAMAARLSPSRRQPPRATDAAVADTVFTRFVGSPLHEALLGSVWDAGQRVHAALPDGGAPPELLNGVVSLLERFDSSFYLDEGDRDETQRHTAVMRWAKAVDVDLMAAALAELGALGQPARLKSIRRAAAGLPHQLDPDLPAAFSGDIHFAEKTPWGWLIVGGKGPTVFGEDAAIIIDLGGDDLYLGGGRVAASPEQPVGLIIDLAGDDRYLDRRPVGAGAAIAGVAAVIDCQGDDLYEGTTMAQASAFAGGALLIDLGGQDVYLGDLLTQGAALFGVALLIDEKGDDLFSAAQFAQGFAGPRAVAAVVDVRGADRYITDRSRPSGYGTPGVYKGWAQGAGCGLRGFAAGGLGLLLDNAGNDEYRGGNFSQGVGYFFGLGGLVDRSGHDRYMATRYSQGTAAHQAVGVLIDESGDDTYEGRIAANQGASWDASIGLLIDHRGDDDYRGAGLAQGAAAMNGFAVLYDGGGDDAYTSSSGQADGGSTQYWGGRNAPNLALFIDREGRDTYNLEGRADGARWRRSRVGLFHDQTSSP